MSDGQPLTADDVAWTFNAVKTNPALQKANGGLVEQRPERRAPRTPDPRVVLAAPQAANPGFELPIVPKHVWEKQPDPSTYANDTDTVGSGPFISSRTRRASRPARREPEVLARGGQGSGLTYAYYKNTDASSRPKNGEVDIVGS